MTIPADAGLWEGGSREHYYAIELLTGRHVDFPGQNSAPWDKGRRETIQKIEPGIAVVCHSMFCGKDMGLTFYVHPDNANKLLPAPQAELSPEQKLVLSYTAHRKSSYAGRDRYQMAMDDARHGYGENRSQVTMTREQWDAAKQSLIGRGLLNKAGAITPAGRNAANS